MTYCLAEPEVTARSTRSSTYRARTQIQRVNEVSMPTVPTQ
jgi:hypothetical protein